jgi:hypothetical protein
MFIGLVAQPSKWFKAPVWQEQVSTKFQIQNKEGGYGSRDLIIKKQKGCF